MRAANNWGLPRGSGPKSGRKKKPPKVDGLRVHRSAMRAFRDYVRVGNHRALLLGLLEDASYRLPGGVIHENAEATLAEHRISRRRLYEIAALYPDVVRLSFRGPQLHLFSEWALHCCRDRERDRGDAWDKTLAFHRRWPGTYAFTEEAIEALRRARTGGKRRGLAARVAPDGFGPEHNCSVDNLGETPVERAGDSFSRPRRVRPVALEVRPIPESYPPNSDAEVPSPTDLSLPPLRPLLDLHPHKIIDGLDPLRSLGTRATQARAPLPQREPERPPVRQEGPERISFVLERERAKPPETEPAKAPPAPIADTETRLQGASGAQGAEGLRKPVSVSRGRPPGASRPHADPEAGFPEQYPPNSTSLTTAARPDWISYPTFEATFVRLMRATKPKWRFIRTGECVAALRCVWERFCPGKPLRWLEPWLDTQIDRFTANVRQDGYQGPGFLRHMRAASVFVPIPPPHVVQAVRKPTAPEETPVEVRAAILASFAKAGGDP